jgi:hypothetical protein
MATQRQKFSTQADPVLLAELRTLAEQEGRQFQAVMEDAMRLYLENRKSNKPRPHVMAHFQASLEQNRELGRLLAQ